MFHLLFSSIFRPFVSKMFLHASFLAAALAFFTPQTAAQRTYRVEYDALNETWRYARQTRNDTTYRALKRKPILLEDDRVELVVVHANPLRFDLDMEYEVSGNSTFDSEDRYGGEESGLFNTFSDIVGSYQLDKSEFWGFQIPTAPNLSFGASTRGAGTAAPFSIPEGLSDREEERFTRVAMEFAQQIDRARVFSEDFQDNYFEALDLVQENLTRVNEVLALPYITPEQVNACVQLSERCLSETENMIHVQELSAAVTNIERFHAELVFLEENIDSEIPEIGEAWNWAGIAKTRLYPDVESQNNVVSAAEHLSELTALLKEMDLSREWIIEDLDEMDDAELEIELSFFDLEPLSQGKNQPLQQNPPEFHQSWFRNDAYWHGLEIVDAPCPGCSPLLWAEGGFDGYPDEDPHVAVKEDGACGNWRFFDAHGMVTRAIKLLPCESDEDMWLEGVEPMAHTVSLNLRSQRNIKSSSGLSLMAIAPFQPLLSYRVEEDDLSETFMIRGSEQTGFIPAVGTSLIFESQKGRWLKSGLSLGLAYAVQDGADLNITLGPTFRLRNLPELSITGGIAYSRMERLKSEFQLDTPYPQGEGGGYSGFEYSDFLLENRFDFGFYFGIVLKN